MTTTPKVWRAAQQANFTHAGFQSDPAIVDIGSDRYVMVWTEASGGPIATSLRRLPSRSPLSSAQWLTWPS